MLNRLLLELLFHKPTLDDVKQLYLKYLMKGIIAILGGLALSVNAQFNFQINNGGFRFGILGSELLNIGGNKRGQNFDTSTSFPLMIVDEIISIVNPPPPPRPRSIPTPPPPPKSVPVPAPTPIPASKPQKLPGQVPVPGPEQVPEQVSEQIPEQVPVPMVVPIESMKESKISLPEVKKQVQNKQNAIQSLISKDKQKIKQDKIKIQSITPVQVKKDQVNTDSSLNQKNIRQENSEQIPQKKQTSLRVNDNVKTKPNQGIRAPDFKRSAQIQPKILDVTGQKQKQQKYIQQLKKKEQQRLVKVISLMSEKEKEHLRALGRDKTQA